MRGNSQVVAAEEELVTKRFDTPKYQFSYVRADGNSVPAHFYVGATDATLDPKTFASEDRIPIGYSLAVNHTSERPVTGPRHIN
ncbi:hypothetical protein [Aporhodopirellula aestuarii]|uniref:Uncharacterized protein n=1 Tax=Aporhodopirellula aestuarii TaxID=2950107 RepID=A0ABT0U0R5_9BACT|nr:hypothetical protein [Aporhodopirellula aestuarii]MCM2370440.1 hypothetical protein [Aporhodopirellula aestuarii]